MGRGKGKRVIQLGERSRFPMAGLSPPPRVEAENEREGDARKWKNWPVSTVTR